MAEHYYTRESCRICSSKKLFPFLDLGKHPPSDAFLKKSQVNLPEARFPLEVCLCTNCHLVQLRHVVSPDVLYAEDYPYLASISPRMQRHFDRLAESVTKRFDVKSEDLVVDVGGNDGTLLLAFEKYGASKSLCIDPGQATILAQEKGVGVMREYFTYSSAKKARERFGEAKIIVGTNVFAHVDNLHDFLKAVDVLLKKDGLLVLEFPYLVNLIKENQFDTIYHEHLSYFSLKPLKRLFEDFDMKIFDVLEIPVHGGSLRLFVQKSSGKFEDTGKLTNLLHMEKVRDIYDISTYSVFADKTHDLKKQITKVLRKLKSDGKKIAGDTAPAKGNTLLNYCKIGPELVNYIVEINSLKQGLYTPGTHIPIYPPEKLLEDKPDYLLILAWNIKEDVIDQQKEFADQGGKFIVPIPKPKII